MISFRQKGDFSKLSKFLERAKEAVHLGNLDKFGQAGVDALRSATPADSGKTAESWYYEIEHDKNGAKISFNNSNINKGVNIAIILQYGHGTRNGGWVEGRDYINPAIQPVFDKITEDALRGLEEIMKDYFGKREVRACKGKVPYRQRCIGKSILLPLIKGLTRVCVRRFTLTLPLERGSL